MRSVSREELKAMNLDYVEEIFSREKTDHEVVDTGKGDHERHRHLRWKADPVIDMLFKHDAIDLNDLFRNGANKNDPLVREFYRRMGYSLFGYWELFHWEVNNDQAENYKE